LDPSKFHVCQSVLSRIIFVYGALLGMSNMIRCVNVYEIYMHYIDIVYTELVDEIDTREMHLYFYRVGNTTLQKKIILLL